MPEASDRENCKHLIQRLFRDHARLNIIVSDISIAPRPGKITRRPDKRNIVFKLYLHDSVQNIFAACKAQKPASFVYIFLTPLRNKLLYALSLLRKKFLATVIGCRSLISGEVTVFVAATGTNGGTHSGPPSVASASTATSSTPGSSLETSMETTSTSTAEATTGGGNTINSKQQLQRYMTDHLNASSESSRNDW